MSTSRTLVLLCVLFGLSAGTASALSMETVLVGNRGNIGELAGAGAGGAGPDRVCGAVNYIYSIGKYEVTAGQYCEFLNKVAKKDPNRLCDAGMSCKLSIYGCGIDRTGSSGNYTYSVDPAFVSRPVNFVSYWDACRFANWLHNGQPTGPQGVDTTERGAYTLDWYNSIDGRTIQRNAGARWAVASEDEWYKAAYYNPTTSSYYDYPTSSNTVPGRDMADVSGNNANWHASSSPYPIDSGRYTTVVGEFQNSCSPYGTFDQAGNMYEWNETLLRDGSANRVYRGGSFDLNDSSLMLASVRVGTFPSYEDARLGFRVVMVPEPACTLLCVVALLAVVLRRR